ncbi:hypothetical protein L915_11890 [Phytophthora nicotianae]|uniref:Uncharacterized protein n=1 Tax=Phytophthora nicotianae TaxID=4792 RepID=W2GIB2_PHYNI|nr:hypothetical protein L915_11890 [Phytophthora nicotianae]ETL36176.1 hypothetical protein L916_11818 [Phytophthora nicotianae]
MAIPLANGKTRLVRALADFGSSSSICSYALLPHTCKGAESRGYDCIIGRDLILSLKLNFDFERRVMEWDGLEVPMRLRVNLASERYVYESPASVQAAKKRMVQILDAKYAKVNLDSCIPDHLDSNQQHALRKLLELFDDLNEAGLGKNYSVPIVFIFFVRKY